MSVAPTAPAPDRRTPNVWCDDHCPICIAEIGLMRRLDSAAASKFVDLSLPGGCPTDRAVRLARLHAQPRDGPMVSGAAAFVTIWRSVPRLRPFAALSSQPPVRRLLERACLVFLRLSLGLQALAPWAMRRQWGVCR